MNAIAARLHRYPKFVLLFLTIVAAYWLFSLRDTLPFQHAIASIGYLGIFLVGMLYSYGFTAAPATALLLILAREQSIVPAALVAGLGALASDLLLFAFIRHSFADESKRLMNESMIKMMVRSIPAPLRKHLIALLAAIIIASPLPDEVGISLLAISTKVTVKSLSVMSYLLNTAGILVVLLIGSAIG